MFNFLSIFSLICFVLMFCLLFVGSPWTMVALILGGASMTVSTRMA